jgi:hypothetical protein
MMNHINRNVPSLFQTLLTERVCLDVTFPYLPPSFAVSLVCFGVTAVVVVLKVALAFVFLTVITVRKVRTTGIGTGLFRFLRHSITSRIYGKTKALTD